MPESWKKNFATIKDIVFIVGIIVSTVGWVRSETIKKTNLENTVKTLTVAVDANTKQLEKINDILREQSNLNGQAVRALL